MNIRDLIDGAAAGDERALPRLISLIVDDDSTAHTAVGELYRRGGNAHVVGVTGAPGAGKSTLVSAIVGSTVQSNPGNRVAVLAVDPSSPFTGGAILGDRIRMGDHAGNPNVFIRSVANRGHLGGIASTTPAVVAALDGVGFDEIIVETVGVGQAEVEIASAAETTIVVVNPGWGDGIQAAKAGFLEVADIFVINKADRSGVEPTIADLTTMLEIGPELEWVPPIVATVGTTGEGTRELMSAIHRHREHLDNTSAGEARRSRIARHALLGALRSSVEVAVEKVEPEVVERLVHRSTDPWAEAAAILGRG